MNMDSNEILQEAPPEKKSKTGLIIAIVAVVLLCCCAVVVGGGIWLWNNGDALFSGLSLAATF
jgi:Kef-type K+ transport system membrane component KefB